MNATNQAPMVTIAPATPVTALDDIRATLASVDAAMLQMNQEHMHNLPLWSKLQDARSSAVKAYKKMGGKI